MLISFFSSFPVHYPKFSLSYWLEEFTLEIAVPSSLWVCKWYLFFLFGAGPIILLMFPFALWKLFISKVTRWSIMYFWCQQMFSMKSWIRVLLGDLPCLLWPHNSVVTLSHGLCVVSECSWGPAEVYAQTWTTAHPAPDVLYGSYYLCPVLKHPPLPRCQKKKMIFTHVAFAVVCCASR